MTHRNKNSIETLIGDALIAKFFNVKICIANYLFENYIIGKIRVTTLVIINFEKKIIITDTLLIFE
jgi:hypothetical protein